jgi:hypothetical protein
MVNLKYSSVVVYPPINVLSQGIGHASLGHGTQAALTPETKENIPTMTKTKIICLDITFN